MKVSIIIPVYNVEKYLTRCLDSIFKQTFSDFEVICINDGSTDSSIQILEKYSKNHKNLRYYNIENAGQANARNLGVKYSKGEFICFIDSDDYIANNMVETLVYTQEKDNCDMVLCGIERIFEDGCTHFEKSFKYDADLVEKHNIDIYVYPNLITIINNSPFSKLIRRESIINNEIVFPVGYIYEDLVFTHKLIATGIKISIITDKLYKYIVRKGSTMTSKKSKATDMFDAFNMVLQFYKELNIYSKFKKELDYLAIYHIGVGTSYRMIKSKQYGVFKSLKRCKSFLDAIDCNRNNVYFKQKSLLEKIYVKIFM